MEYLKLTGTGIEVSKICLGTLTMGDQVSEADSIAAVEYAIDEGVNFIDTANVYNAGRSEEITGKAIKGKRDKLIVASKVGNGMGCEGNPPNERGGLSRRYIIAELEKSLKRLQTDYVDIYYLHTPDVTTSAEETLDAMDCIVRSGKARYIGASNYAAWQLCELYYTARENKVNRPVVTQMVYNIITRGIEQELLPFLREYKMGMVVYNPLAAGFLTDKYKDKKQLPNTRFTLDPKYAARYWNQDSLQAWDDVYAIAQEAGVSMVDMAMRWLHTSSDVDAIITGFTSMEQLKQNLRSLDNGKLDAGVMAACDKVWNALSGTRFKYNR